MKVSLKWLNEYVEVPTDIKAFCDKLDLTGTGVEGVETLGAAFDHVVTAKVLKKEHHPDSDHMWVCSVDVGGLNVDKEGNPEPLPPVRKEGHGPLSVGLRAARTSRMACPLSLPGDLHPEDGLQTPLLPAIDPMRGF